MAPGLQRGDAVLGAVGTLAVSNVVANRLLPEAVSVPWHLTVASTLGWLARSAGVDAADVGLDPRQVGAGIRVGAVAAGLVAASYAGLLVRGDVAVLNDRRVTELTRGEAWYQALVRIPLGTVMTEELAFRGVLPTLLQGATTSTWLPVALSSLLFGFWHVLPSRPLIAANDEAARVADSIGAVGVTTLAVAGTTLAGFALHALRVRGRHLIAPAAAHWAINTMGLVAARLAARRR